MKNPNPQPTKTFIHICPKCKTSVILHIEGTATCIKCALNMPSAQIASKAFSKPASTNINELAQNSQLPINPREFGAVL